MAISLRVGLTKSVCVTVHDGFCQQGGSHTCNGMIHVSIIFMYFIFRTKDEQQCC